MNWFIQQFKKKKIKIFHVGPEKCADNYVQKGVEYYFFPTKPFIGSDNIMGLWDRAFNLMAKKKPDIILLQLTADNMLNDFEEKKIRTLGTVIKLPNG